MTSTSAASTRMTSTVTRDGTVVALNDHVYMASEFTGDSYYIGRIMEFAKQIKGKPPQVRIGWFYRPKDVMARRNHDPRLLVATMHSDLNPLASIRGRCVVTHLAYIKDLDAYKKEPDHFYYHQLFDRYIHRFYDVLPVESVRNLPLDVSEELGKRYQYIAVEAGTASEYTDAHRVCLICKRWCASGEALKCIMCQGFHHMLCINPPMLRKPSKGFAFQCALCSKLAMEADSSSPTSLSSSSLKHSATSNASISSSGQNTPRGSPKQKSLSVLSVHPSNSPTVNTGGSPQQGSSVMTSSIPDSNDQKMSHMWPFRYFGTHADIQDIFDPDDRVYPRASSRVGTRFQAAVVKWEGPGQILATSTLFDDPSNRLMLLMEDSIVDLSEASSRAQSASLEVTDGLDPIHSPSSPARSAILQDEPAHIERGGDDTVSLLFAKPKEVTDDYVAKYMEQVKALSLPVAAHSADMMDRALLELQKNDFDADKALDIMAKLTKRDFDIRDWSAEEIAAFEEGIQACGHELFAIKNRVATRSMKDIVRFFYHWKKTERYQPVYSVFTNIHKPNKKFKSVGRRALTLPVVDAGSRHATFDSAHEIAVDHDSLILPTAENALSFECSHCGTTTSTMWRRALGETDLLNKHPKVLCDSCGDYWVRYVTLPPLADLSRDSKKSKSKDGSAKGHAHGPIMTLSSSPVPSEVLVGVKRKRGESKSGTKKVKDQSQEPSRSSTPLPEAPCVVCGHISAPGEELLVCQHCRLTVHHDCYGATTASQAPWTCDTCENKRTPSCSMVTFYFAAGCMIKIIQKMQQIMDDNTKFTPNH
ncbi:putative PHD type zinc finger protein with BAH domain-containing protein, partial [Podila epigama]